MNVADSGIEPGLLIAWEKAMLGDISWNSQYAETRHTVQHADHVSTCLNLSWRTKPMGGAEGGYTLP